jgi:hypothetical protein
MPKVEARYILTPGDQDMIDRSWEARNPSIFTDFYMKPAGGGYMVYPGSVRHAQYYQAWTASGRPKAFTAETGEIRFQVTPRLGDFRHDAGLGSQPARPDNQIAFHEDRGFVFPPWQLEFFRAPQEQRTIIGLTGTGKTAGVGLLAMFLCATLPGFR